MPMEVGERDLKTSHVTVYLANRIKGGHLTIFKNISCYSLSAFLWIIKNMNLNLKTSHVTVYHMDCTAAPPADGI